MRMKESNGLRDVTNIIEIWKNDQSQVGGSLMFRGLAEVKVGEGNGRFQSFIRTGGHT